MAEVTGIHSTTARRLAVLGSPIAHSRSPVLHAAAYRVLGLDWRYEAVEVTSDALAGFVRELGPDWLGLSLTMPLKQTVLPLLADRDRMATVTGAANTVLVDCSHGGEPALRGFNTDVAGIVRALRAAGVETARYVQILGGGATAASALVAAAELGAERVAVRVRSVERAAPMQPLGKALGLVIEIAPLHGPGRALEVPDLVVSTLPGTATVDPESLFSADIRAGSVLLDVAYQPWPSALSRAWQDAGGRSVPGLAMLVHQALLQVRIFVGGDPFAPLTDEDAVLAAMLASVRLDAGV